MGNVAVNGVQNSKAIRNILLIENLLLMEPN